jgi:hypothetical protein
MTNLTEHIALTIGSVQGVNPGPIRSSTRA